MAEFSISTASSDDIAMLRTWAAQEQWNPGVHDGTAFHAADPGGFFVGRLDGEPISSISAVRYGTGFGFIGFYITRPEFRGQGYGIQVWRTGMDHLAGRTIGLDGVVDQQDNYRKSGFRPAWNNIRFEGVPTGEAELPSGVRLVDARTLPFPELAGYDRRFFPAARDAFLSCWIGHSGNTARAAVDASGLRGLAVLRPAGAASRIGPFYADSPEVAAALLHTLAATAPGQPVAVDVPDVNDASVHLMKSCGMVPSFETARMYTGPAPEVRLDGIFGVSSLELG